jgi:hypothetical protein
MKYDELLIKIREMKLEYEKKYNKPLETVAELEKYIMERQVRFGKRKNLTSLRGIF